MIHIDLFSGIGGFALAADAVWDNVSHVFCEIDPYCQALLKKRFKGSVIYGDIREIIADAGSKESGGIPNGNCYILTGGFPCQPFSQAGKRKGTEDDRYLWPEMLRVIREFSPEWVIAENVRGIINIQDGVVFEQVCLDLEGEDYEVQPFIIPAVAKNAPHRRDRVWIVAHSRCEYGEGTTIGRESETPQGSRSNNESEQSDTGVSNAPDTAGWQSGQSPEREGREDFSRRSWEANWLEVATKLCGVDDGLPAELDGLKLSKSRHRKNRLKALGNAIVPQVAIEIMRAIDSANNQKNNA